MMFVIKLKITQLFRFIFQWIGQVEKFVCQYIAHSKPLIGILTFVIGVSWTWVVTYSAFEGKDLLHFVRVEAASYVDSVASKLKPTDHKEWVFINDRAIEVAQAAEVVPEEAVVPQDDYQTATIKRLSREAGIDWKLVYAVCKKESGCNPEINCHKQYGRCDEGLSFGAYQIYNPKLDPERKRMAENFEEATMWTIQNGYRFKDTPETFFKNHNGLYKKTNQWYVDGAMEIYKTL